MAQKASRPELNRLEAVILANHRRFLSFLKSRVGSEETAEDILQAAYARGLRKSGDLKDADRIIPWFYRLLRNALIDHYRHAGVEKRALETFGADSERRRPAVDRDLERTVCRCVAALVNTLKPEYKDVLTEAEIEDHSIKDIAVRKKISPTNLSVRLHRARKALKDKVLQTCGNCAARGCTDCSCRPV